MKYCPEIVETLVKHLIKGSTVTSACHAVGISKAAFYEWMDKKLDFKDTIKKAQAIPDRKVENSLFKMAKGFFKVKEKHYEPNKDGKRVLVKIIEKIMLPNVTATIFYLKNKKPDDFKDRHEHDHSGTVKHEVSLSLKDLKNSIKKYKENAS